MEHKIYRDSKDNGTQVDGMTLIGWTHSGSDEDWIEPEAVSVGLTEDELKAIETRWETRDVIPTSVAMAAISAGIAPRLATDMGALIAEIRRLRNV